MATAPHDGRTPRTRPASPPCLPHLPRSPQHRSPPGIAPLFSHRARSPAAPGDHPDARSLPCHITCPSFCKKRVGGGWGLGGKESPLCASQGSLLPPKPSMSALLSALAKAATDFYTCMLAGRPHGMPPCPAARGQKRPSRRERARSSPVPAGAMHAGKRCPRACPGPFFTISPLQPSSRGSYELYQGRCLEISCGAPPR